MLKNEMTEAIERISKLSGELAEARQQRDDLLVALKAAWRMLPVLKPKHPDYFERERVRAAIAKAGGFHGSP